MYRTRILEWFELRRTNKEKDRDQGSCWEEAELMVHVYGRCWEEQLPITCMGGKGGRGGFPWGSIGLDAELQKQPLYLFSPQDVSSFRCFQAASGGLWPCNSLKIGRNNPPLSLPLSSLNWKRGNIVGMGPRMDARNQAQLRNCCCTSG